MDLLVSSEESVSENEIVDQINLSREVHVEYIRENCENNINNPELVLENVCVLTLAPEGEVPIVDLTDFDDGFKVLEDEDEEEMFTTKHTYFDLNQNSMKIVSFLELKEKLENNLCCWFCASKKCISNIIVEQNTYKLMTVLSFTCKYGHDFTIAPEHIDDKKIDSSDNFKINFCSILAMQILGKGLCTMSTFWVSSESMKA